MHPARVPDVDPRAGSACAEWLGSGAAQALAAGSLLSGFVPHQRERLGDQAATNPHLQHVPAAGTVGTAAATASPAPPAIPTALPDKRPMVLATTSTQDSGLLDVLVFQAGATWISRDDNSGTDQLEKQLWREAGLDPKGKPWYVVSGQGMGATLTLADQKDAYTLCDRATYLARK